MNTLRDGRRVTPTITPGTWMRIFSSRSGTIRRSSPALALTRPMSACSIKVSCLHVRIARYGPDRILSTRARSHVHSSRCRVCRGFFAMSLCLATVGPCSVFASVDSDAELPASNTTSGCARCRCMRFGRGVFLAAALSRGMSPLRERWMRRVNNTPRCWRSRPLPLNSPA